MSLANPIGLLGLLTLPVIVGLHLFLERNHRAVVSSLFLWAFLDPKLQGVRPRQIRLTWLLILDLLIATFLSLGLAQPQIELPALFAEDSHIIVLMDTSTSMLAEDVAPSRIDQAKEEVFDLINQVGQNGIVSVVSVSNTVEIVGDTRESSSLSLKGMVSDIVAGGSTMNLRAGLAAAQSIMSEKKDVAIHIVTDGAIKYENLDDFPYPVRWHIIGSVTDNQAVAAPQLVETGDGQFQLMVQLINYSNRDRMDEIKVTVDGREIRRMEVFIPARSAIPYIIALTGNVDYAQVEIGASDVLGVDNFAGVGRAGGSAVRAALVTTRPDPLDRAIGSGPNVTLSMISPTEYNYAADYDLTIFRDFLPSEWPDGVILVVDPPVNSESEILEVAGVDTIDQPIEIFNDPLTGGLDFSGVRWQDARGMLTSLEEFSPLISAGDTALMLEQGLESGNLIVFLPFLDVGSLTKHPVFPLLVSNVIESARGFHPGQQFSVGENLTIPAEIQGQAVILRDPASNEVNISANGVVRLAQFGQYSIQIQNPPNEPEEIYFGVNAGDLTESNLNPQPWTVFLAQEEGEAEGDAEIVFELAPWLLGVVVVLLLVEAWRAWR